MIASADKIVGQQAHISSLVPFCVVPHEPRLAVGVTMGVKHFEADHRNAVGGHCVNTERPVYF